MKTLVSILTLLFVSKCSTELVDSWKDPEVETYIPSKTLILGITPNIAAKKQFEEQLKTEFNLRGTEAVTGLEWLDYDFYNDRMTEEGLDILEDKLIADGFDTILLTKVIGVENKIVYKKNYKDFESTQQTFKEEFFQYQGIYHKPEYYEAYKLIHAETTLYCLCPDKDRQLIWKGYIDITDPSKMESIINEYVHLVITTLEEESLITSRPLTDFDNE